MLYFTKSIPLFSSTMFPADIQPFRAVMQLRMGLGVLGFKPLHAWVHSLVFSSWVQLLVSIQACFMLHCIHVCCMYLVHVGFVCIASLSRWHSHGSICKQCPV